MNRLREQILSELVAQDQIIPEGRISISQAASLWSGQIESSPFLFLKLSDKAFLFLNRLLTPSIVVRSVKLFPPLNNPWRRWMYTNLSFSLRDEK